MDDPGAYPKVNKKLVAAKEPLSSTTDGHDGSVVVQNKPVPLLSKDATAAATFSPGANAIISGSKGSKRPVVAVDLDEVLGQFVPQLCAFHNDTYGSTLTPEAFTCYGEGYSTRRLNAPHLLS